MTYDHQAKVESLTEEEYNENMKWAFKSFSQATAGKLVTCRGCGKDFKLINLFRCYFCGSYFCRKCGKEHFKE